MSEKTKYLLIGGGVASVNAAKGIRAHDKDGRVVLVTADRHMPYDRPPLSKNFLADPLVTHDDISSKYDHWYADNHIEVKLDKPVRAIERRSHVATLENGDEIEYEKLLLATGSRAAKLSPAVHQNSPDIFTLRSLDDAIVIRSFLERTERAVVIGTGFLGPEVASQIRQKGIDTTIVAPTSHLWDRFASPDLGAFLNGYYESKGVTMLLNRRIATIQDGLVFSGLEDRIPYDMVFAAIGAHLNYELAKEGGVGFYPNDGIKVSERLQTFDDPDIYAAGDIAFFPDFTSNKETHYEHHLNAQWQGEVAGANMAGADQPYQRVPYFFSDFFDLHMVLRGQSSTNKFASVLGSFESADFIELYADESGFLRMGIAISRDEKKLDPISDKLEALIPQRPKVNDLTMADFT